MADIELRKLKGRRACLKARLTRASTYLDSLQNDVDLCDLKTRQAKLQPSLEEFEEVQSSIEILENSDYQESEYSDFEEAYLSLLTKYQRLVDQLQSKPSITNSPSQPEICNVKLPVINLPNFKGLYEEWIPFHDTFNSLIHLNKTIPEIQKFHYLRSSLSGDAAAVLHSLSISEENYNIAWDMLRTRYDNKRIIIQQHIRNIFELPSLTKNSHSLLRHILDSVLKNTRALKSLKRPIEHWDDLLVYIISSKLDTSTREDWESQLPDSAAIPSFDSLTAFLNKRCKILETLHVEKSSDLTKGKSTLKSVSHIITSNNLCANCSKKHFIHQCEEFLKQNAEQRINTARSKKLCLNCLKPGHHSSNCTSSSCKTCKRKHNTLLHIEHKTNIQTTESSNPNVATISNHSSRDQPCETILSTAIILIQDTKGHSHECRVLLDCGSQSNFITKALVERLHLKQQSFSMPVLGINQISTNISKSVNVAISSRINAFQTTIKCLVLDKITNNLPTTSINLHSIKIPNNIRIADPNFHVSQPIDMLIGVDLFWKLLCVGQIKGTSNQPCWQKTHFGWIVAGSTPLNNSATTVCNLITQNLLDDKLALFWKLEECNTNKSFTPEETACENHFQNNTTRDENGRYIVKLPFKSNTTSLGESYTIALKRFHNLERRFQRNPELKQEYTKFIHEYAALGHMSPVTTDTFSEEPSSTFYLPHHAVEKLDSSTTKLRVVFDGSCKTSTGISINDILMVGPTIQQDLFCIICRFRTYQIAITADIAKMYRQVLVDPSDTSYQRILWRDNICDEIQIFNLSTVTYGTASASFLAIRALHQLAQCEQERFPLASKITLRDFYVDDLITGANTPEEATNIVNELMNLLPHSGFELRKWNSNQPLILESSHVSPSTEIIHTVNKYNVKALGLLWNTSEDYLSYNLPNQPINTKITKRSILSFISQLFDPLGLLGPVVLVGKVLMQELWQLKTDWDESVPLDVFTAFNEFRNQLFALKDIKIPRKVIFTTVTTTIELHGFSDASQRAYGACVYIRSINNDGSICSSLLCAKSKVAPIKAVTIPRLELCGALLLSRLMEKVKEIIDIKLSKAYYWTDSNIVLAWIKSETKKWNIFVANRVSEIRQSTTSDQWHHVSTEANPADIISRGCIPLELNTSNLWWHGPPWLVLGNFNVNNGSSPKFDTTEEERRSTSCHTTCTVITNELFSRYSSLSRLLRITSLCRRFINNMKLRMKNEHSKIHTGPLSVDEIDVTRKAIVKLLQKEYFLSEYNDLRKTGTVGRGSKLLSLSPFLDDDSLIRVGGRLKHSILPYAQKHPIILPAKHPFTILIIEHYHKIQFHSGMQGTIASIREQYWPLSLRASVRSTLRKCVLCFKVKPSNSNCIMGELPENRIKQARPFTNSGLDFCGPFQIRERKGRGRKTYKIYVAIFVCFATKAIHVEIVNDLTSAACLNAIKRFIARRGKVSNLYSDNGTNFIGANNDLKKLYAEVESQKFMNLFSKSFPAENLQWHFIPPRSPHFGGLWEAAVKSMKTHLRRSIGSTTLTFEQLHTLLVQIESILNSRPLTPVSDDPNDYSFLTPGHFIIGDSFTALPESSALDIPRNRLSYWQHIEHLKQHFWKRWYKEYLHQLQQRSKWKQQTTTCLTPGELVIIKEDNTPPLQWIMGRIVEVHPGTDGIVRAASVRTSSGIIKRPVVKLCVLPIDSNNRDI